MIGRAYRYLYYRFFLFNLGQWNALKVKKELGGMAYGQAVGSVSAALLLYIVAIAFVVKGSLGVDLFELPKWILCAIAIGIYALNLLFLGPKRIHNAIMKEFSSETTEQHRLRGFIVLFSVIIPFVVIIGIAIDRMVQ
jgi:lysylphosphatidylglycerol synthetase-like protein (DUF2156 family)